MAPLKNSLLLRLGLLMASITALALAGMLISMVMTDRLRGDASAINQAGSLRMQAYAVLTEALAARPGGGGEGAPGFAAAAAEFLERYGSERLTGVLPAAADDPVRGAYEGLGASWRKTSLPVLTEYLSLRMSGVEGEGLDQARVRAVSGVERLVERIDRFVGALEQRSEEKVRQLRGLHTATLFLTLPLIFLTMYLVQTDVLAPLNALLRAAQRARRGDFSWRVSDTEADELGQLGGAFNRMAQDLSAQYRDLEARVAERTEALRRSNHALELLYRTLSRLNSDPASAATYRALLLDLQEVLGLVSGAMCVVNPGDGRGHIWITAPASGTPCTATSCAPCLEPGEARVRAAPGSPPGDPTRQLTVPLGDKGHAYGVINLELAPGTELEDWQMHLATAVGRHVAMAVANTERSMEVRRAALLEERAALARELHDSLAQSLSYLKIQVTRLESALAAHPAASDAAQPIEELRTGLNGAYRQLRELLTTFRLEMDGRGLIQALEQTVAELQPRTATRLVLDNRLGGCRLSPNQEIHVLQVVREALSNVLRHARATVATVCLECIDGDRVRVAVRDDGVGLPAAAVGVHHHGLTIMKERAESLGGALGLEPQPGGGTTVRLEFPLTSEGAAATAPAAFPAAGRHLAAESSPRASAPSGGGG